MRGNELLEVIEYLNPAYIEAAAEKPKTRKAGWLKWGAMAACLCLVVGAVLLNFDITNDAPEIVSQFKTPAGEKYLSPPPGEYVCVTNVNDARKYYEGQDVKYLLSFNMFKIGGEYLSDEEQNIEYRRLVGLGYELYEVEKWTYQGNGEKIYYSVVVGLFSEEELAAFQVNPAYGYLFRFEANGDGSAVSIDDGELITEFNTGTKA